jgi:hypothetical protein
VNPVSFIIYIFRNMIFVQVSNKMRAIEASDEIVCRFCNLYGGLEAAMPFIAHQFKKAGADFRNPTREELMQVVEGLLRLLEDSSPTYIVDRERRIMLRWVRNIEPT